MTEVYFLISLIIITDGIIFYCKYLFDKPHILDKDLQPDLIIGSNYWDSFALPLVFVLPFFWLQIWTRNNPNLYFLPFVLITILTITALILLIKYRFKRYYLTDKGIIILNLFTNKYFTINIGDVKGYSYRKGYRSSPCYIVATSQKGINFSVRQIKNIAIFKDYLKKHNIQYYEYDLLTGNDYKK